MPVGHLQLEHAALEGQLREALLQPLNRRVRPVDEHAGVVPRRVAAGELGLCQLQLGALPARPFDLGAELREQREQHRGLRPRGDHAVGLAERPHLLLGALHPRLEVPELLLDELPRLRDADVAERPRVFLVELGHRVGRVARLAGIGRGGGDLDDVRPADAAGLEPARERVDDRRVGLRLADRRRRAHGRELAEPLGDLLEHGEALDDRRLRLDRVVARRERQDLNEQPGQGRGLLEPDRRGRLISRHLLLREPEAEDRHEDGRREDDDPAAADDAPVVPEVHFVLGHALPSHQRALQ